MATQGRLSSGCPFQLCTAPALASPPPLSLSLSLQPPPLYFLHTHPSSLLFSSSPSHTHSQQALNHTRINLYHPCICMQISLYKHSDSMCLKPVSLSVSPLLVPTDPHSSTHPLRQFWVQLKNQSLRQLHCNVPLPLAILQWGRHVNIKALHNTEELLTLKTNHYNENDEWIVLVAHVESRVTTSLNVTDISRKMCMSLQRQG